MRALLGTWPRGLGLRSNRSDLLLLLFTKEQGEHIAPVTLYVKSDGRDSLLLLFTKEQKSEEGKNDYVFFKSDPLFLKVGIYDKTSNSCFSSCFSSFYTQNKRANCSSLLFLLVVKEGIALLLLKNE